MQALALKVQDLHDRTGYSEVLEEQRREKYEWPVYTPTFRIIDLAPLYLPILLRYLTPDEQRVLARSLRASVRIVRKGKK
jgi:hypothetical protein